MTTEDTRLDEYVMYLNEYHPGNTAQMYTSHVAAYLKAGNTQPLAYLSSLATSEHPKTLSNIRCAIKHYLRWRYRMGLDTRNMASGIRNPHVRTRLPEVPDEQQDAQMLVNANTSLDYYARIAFMVIRYTGMKASEFLSFSTDWITENGHAVLVKGERARRVEVLNTDARAFLAELKTRFPGGAPLWPFASPNSLTNYLGRIARGTGIRVTAQLLRDTYAVDLLKQGYTRETVTRWLGLTESDWEDSMDKYEELADR